MKTLSLLALISVIALISWQHREITRLSIRENTLLENMPEAPDSSAPISTPNLVSLRGGPERADRTDFDIQGYIAKCMDLIARSKRGEISSEKDHLFLWEDPLDASPGDLKALVEKLKNSDIPEAFLKDILSMVAYHLIDSDPEFAVKLVRATDGYGDALLDSLRAWSSRNPKAAAAWLQRAQDEDPPFDASRFGNTPRTDFEALSLAVRLAADPAGEGLEDLLQLQPEPLVAALSEIVSILPATDLPHVLNQIARHGKANEEERLILIASVLAYHLNPADARDALSGAGLPPEPFAKTASLMIGHLDPISIRAGADWFLLSASGEARAAGLRRIVARWADHDRESAAAWAAGLIDPGERAEALKVIGRRPLSPAD